MIISKDISFAVDEHIWGHRLYDEQLPHLTVLEFLNVLLSNSDAPLREKSGEAIRYQPQHQTRLRNLLFNNPYIDLIRSEHIPDDAKWSRWLSLFNQDATEPADQHLPQLRRNFSTFDDFGRAIELIRASAFEGQSNKRWSSRFVFPFGPDALYEDLRFDSKANASNDRRFFARTGELLYLMMSRAQRGAELGSQIVTRLFAHDAPMNRLVKALQGEPQKASNSKEVGYLPHAHDARFDQLCDDWLAILNRDLPVYDGLDHLITLTGLNLLLYFLEQGRRTVRDAEPVEFLCEIISSQRTKIRSLSIAGYQHNQNLSQRAVLAYIESLRSAPEWEKALASDDPSGACAMLVKQKFQYEKDDDSSLDGLSGDQLLDRLADRARSRHEQHLGKLHGTWARAIGLSSRRLTRRVRYAPSDRLLKALVVAVVDGAMEFSEFLAEIHRRYGIVVGHAEGRRFVQSQQIDQEALMNNANNLETRLLALGLVRRLSDSCAFVENPFSRRGAV
ncbi:hypothetical protein [Caballeronia zhejiangensis]|uniref:Uncharacterized protein n=1 Tax=Caballeronia zhejiangensis TaxID=871203 RepID=A0A656QHI3_9BURK|nr:hypothetical protein [Caballeronia zhejiangensis]KDR27150.1 hypothetical protein BG60_18240 [Caballeronia zhejiangensis]